MSNGRFPVRYDYDAAHLIARFEVPDGTTAVAVSFSGIALTFGPNLDAPAETSAGGFSFDSEYPLQNPVVNGEFRLDLGAYIKEAGATRIKFSGSVWVQVLFFGP
jgi:hypothetical protein